MYNTTANYITLRCLLLVKYEYLDKILYHCLVYFLVFFLGLVSMMYVEVT